MKFHAYSIAAALLLAASSAQADLDLTPTVEVHQMERMKIQQVIFHDGPTQIIYEPPHGWTCSGSTTSASLSIPNHPQARATIAVAPRLRVPAFDDKVLKEIQANPGLLQLPKGAMNIKIIGIDIDPLVVDTHHTLDIQLTYSFFGQPCAKSIFLVDRKGTEVSFTLDSQASDFQALHGALRSSIFSIENL